MKELKPKKVFIKINNEYREISPEEHEFRKENDAGYREKKFVGLHGMIMEVSEKEYIEFYRSKRRQKYLDEQRRDNGDVSYDALNSDEFNGEDILTAELPDVCDTVVEAIMTDKLRKTLQRLDGDEKKLIFALYFEGKSEHKLSEETGIPQRTINDRKRRIIAKLKKILEN